MSNPLKITRQLLSNNAGVTALLQQLSNDNWPIFAGVLPEHYNPTSLTDGETGTGPAIVLTIKGGSTNPEIPLQNVSVQVVCWAGVNEFVPAHALYTAVVEALHGLQNLDFGDDGRLLSCVEESVGQDMIDKDAGWAMVINSFTLMLTGGVNLTSDITANETVKQYVDDSIAAAIADVATLPIAESEVTGLVADLASKASVTSVTSEVSTRAAADVVIAAAVVTETSRAEAAEAVVASSVTTEATARAAADTTLQTNINTEASTRGTADTTNATAITTETTRAEVAEALLAPKLTPAFSGLVTLENDGIGKQNGMPATASVLIKNAAAATVGTSQNPGSIQFEGTNFDGSVSNLAIIAEMLAVWGSGVSTSANLIIQFFQPSGRGAFYIVKTVTLATSSQNQPFPQFAFEGFYWDGTQSQQETWELNHDLGTGSNPTSKISFNHFGSSGQATLDLANTSGRGGTAFKVLVPTAAIDTNTTDAASCAFVLAQAAAATPLGDGVAAVGTSTRFARADHVHPTDTTLAPKASPALTGTPTAPTASALAGSTQIATCAYDDAAVAVEKARALAAEALLASLASTPQILSSVTTTGLNATNATHQQDFTPTKAGKYRINVVITETATDASGATAVVRLFCANANVAMGVATPILGLTVLGGSQGYNALVVPPATLTNGKMGWSITVTGSPTTGTWSVTFIVEYLGA